MTTLLPTALVGSLPKPSWLSDPETLWAPWRLEGDELSEAKRDALELAATEQRLAGLDIICDGEQTRQHFVTTVHRTPRRRGLRPQGDRPDP
jgi:5-methyltetrahydropteroyltriglutamate--homocysteine methyltransferase